MDIVNVEGLEFRYEPEDPQGFRAGLKRLGPLVGAKRSGMSLYELPPGQAICPYHYEYGEEEWLVVLEGEPTLRLPDGTRRLRPWDVCAFPVGPAGAHGVRNETDAVVRVLMFSEVRVPTATVYPDSDKIGIWTGNEADDAMVPRSANVPYFHGEPEAPREP
jgi:uncharacterized cupin superfamily protein